MELTRRDAVAALAAVGGATATGAGLARLRSGGSQSGDSDGTLPGDERVRETMVAVAEVVYPSGVSGTETFVTEFVGPRLERAEHETGVREAVAELDERARSWHDGRVAQLGVERREQLLREVSADTATEDPEGTTAQRIRYYVVNELLLALYSSPKGGKLVGLENPQGHAGGTESYRLGPR